VSVRGSVQGDSVVQLSSMSSSQMQMQQSFSSQVIGGSSMQTATSTQALSTTSVTSTRVTQAVSQTSSVSAHIAMTGQSASQDLSSLEQEMEQLRLQALAAAERRSQRQLVCFFPDRFKLLSEISIFLLLLYLCRVERLDRRLVCYRSWHPARQPQDKGPNKLLIFLACFLFF
jgi:hypothetical protein